MKKYKIKNATPYGVVCNKDKSKGTSAFIVPDTMPLERDDIKIETIPSRHSLEIRGLILHGQK